MNNDKCYYPTFVTNNEFEIGEHHFDRNGFCIICGTYDPIKDKRNVVYKKS